MVDRAAAPFLKWVGGKRQLLPRILDYVPRKVETYYEPFLGGAAVFFELAQRGLFKRAVLADANVELVNTYQVVRDRVDELIESLKVHHNDEAHYYRVRSQDPTKLDAVTRAARVIYLNRCGYNGLYRVNSRGIFNVPFGRYSRPKICDPDRLRAASRALALAEINHLDFGELLGRHAPGKRDFVYLDPPYVPVSRTASFTAYAARDFGASEQQRLAGELETLGKRRVRALLSNSDCKETRDLYDGLPFRVVKARRAVNSDARGRGPVGELLVQSFAYPVASSARVVSLKSTSGAGRSAARTGARPAGRLGTVGRPVEG